MNESRINVRKLIVDSMLETESDGVYLSDIENAVLDKYSFMDRRDRAFYKRVMDGCSEMRIRIDYILDSFSKTKVKAMKPAIRAILRMSVYQLLWMDSVPDFSVCNEAVKLTVARGLGGLKGYVNGVLRNISRNKDNISYPSKKDGLSGYLSIAYSCPEWICDMFLADYGEKRAESILASFMKERPLSLRIRDASVTEAWKAAGRSFAVNPHIPGAVFIDHAGSVAELEGYDEGAFTVQDTGSMMVAMLSLARPGDIVMDLCAAPGGKSMHVADMIAGSNSGDLLSSGVSAPKTDNKGSGTRSLRSASEETEAAPAGDVNQPTLSASEETEAALAGDGTEVYTSVSAGHVYAYDISESRCERMRENISRLKMSEVVSLEVHDATDYIQDMEIAADVVIADVPCSGLGVLGRKSDIRYRVTRADIDELIGLQRSIADVAVRYVKTGGRLIYSTCTLNPRENGQQAGYIIGKYGFRDITERAFEESGVKPPAGFVFDGPERSSFASADISPGLTLLPDEWEADGFYIAVLEKC